MDLCTLSPDQTSSGELPQTAASSFRCAWIDSNKGRARYIGVAVTTMALALAIRYQYCWHVLFLAVLVTLPDARHASTGLIDKWRWLRFQSVKHKYSMCILTNVHDLLVYRFTPYFIIKVLKLQDKFSQGEVLI